MAGTTDRMLIVERGGVSVGREGGGWRDEHERTLQHTTAHGNTLQRTATHLHTTSLNGRLHMAKCHKRTRHSTHCHTRGASKSSHKHLRFSPFALPLPFAVRKAIYMRGQSKDTQWHYAHNNAQLCVHQGAKPPPQAFKHCLATMRARGRKQGSLGRDNDLAAMCPTRHK